MSKQLKLKIVTPERLILEEMVDQVTLPTTEGEITILPDHIPLIVGLKSGDVVAAKESEYIPMAVIGGFVEVKNLIVGLPSGNPTTTTEVAVLADFAEHVSEISEDKIAEAKAKSEELKKKIENKDHVDFEHFEAELERSLTRVKIADKWRTKKYRK
ncbi:ATP synthase F1 subunit epsilon [Candidatus Nomurabacteria bacterium RIFCSPLOWO2_01_FULL_40_18]|uniref:ATP synthase epsilon chain n=1 Tax=Candidatus Nomurabacteria bacterium RIFCSPLOWO2_01_FULL_40_18 TaxID=1801773 RepID=A0A1F6XK41_9BACT|nr:MAG: ATP synthase F1 subunit epsilon [Candidatus Nomurabacteria bacterium RIFCSPLOWO2_01_FULL_40_18]